MKDYDILIQKGYKYIQFKNIDEFNKYRHLTVGRWFNKDLYYTNFQNPLYFLSYNFGNFHFLYFQ